MKKLSRRDFLKAASMASVGAALAACAPASTPNPTSAPAAASTATTAGQAAAPTATTGAAAPAATATTAPAAPTTAAPSAEKVTMVYLVDESQNTKDTAAALVAAFQAKNPNVTINVETRPGGTEGDNIVKTRLATGEMSDIFWYNTGSLLQALHPTDTLVDISKEAWVANVAESFLPTVSQNGQVFGAPTGTAMGGGILYNKKVYQQLGLSVPKSWAEFEANNEKIKAAGIAPVIATYGDTWTSQLFVLADYYNVEQAVPNFATDYTANKIKFASNPAAMAGFTYLEEGFKKGWWQKDYATTKFEQGLKLLADGKGAHYPQLSFGLSTIATNSPNEVNDIGYFGQPGADAAKNGSTIWMPAGTYIPKTSKTIDTGKAFQAFIASVEGTDAITAKVAPQGPYVVKGAKLPENVLPAVKDIAAYIDAGKSGPALEFVSPVKGPSLEQICVAVGSGQMTAQAGAEAYDKDVEKQAKQLGLPGW